MPYSNVPADKTDEMDRCVNKVMEKQGVSKERAIAICYDSVVGKKDIDTSGLLFKAVIPIDPEKIIKNEDGSMVVPSIPISSIYEDRDKERMSLKCITGMAKQVNDQRKPAFGDHIPAWRNSVGYWSAGVEGKIARASLHIEPGKADVERKADYLREKIDFGTPISFSIFGKTKKAFYEEAKSAGEKFKRRVIDDIELYSIDVVGLPSNRDAVFTVARQISECYGDECFTKMVKDCQGETCEVNNVDDTALDVLVKVGKVEQKCADLARQHVESKIKGDNLADENQETEKSPAETPDQNEIVSKTIADLEKKFEEKMAGLDKKAEELDKKAADMDKTIAEKASAIAEAKVKELQVERPAAPEPPAAQPVDASIIEKQIEEFVDNHGYLGLMQKVN